MQEFHRQDNEDPDWTERAIPAIPIPRPREEGRTGGAPIESSGIPHQRETEE